MKKLRMMILIVSVIIAISVIMKSFEDSKLENTPVLNCKLADVNEGKDLSKDPFLIATGYYRADFDQLLRVLAADINAKKVSGEKNPENLQELKKLAESAKLLLASPYFSTMDSYDVNLLKRKNPITYVGFYAGFIDFATSWQNSLLAEKFPPTSRFYDAKADKYILDMTEALQNIIDELRGDELCDMEMQIFIVSDVTAEDITQKF